MNKNWGRWLFASISKFFIDNCSGINIRIEGQDNPIDKQSTYIEVRMTGPSTIEMSKNVFRLEMQVNVLITVIKDDQDNHLIFKIAGVVESAFQSCIPAFKYGDGPDDNPTESIGYLQRIKNGNRDIDTVHYGQVAPDVTTLQSTVEAFYRIDLDQ